MSVFWTLGSLGLWFPVFTRALCAQCSPSIPLWLILQVLAPAGGRTESPDRALCTPVSHDWRRVCLSFLLVHQTNQKVSSIASCHTDASKWSGGRNCRCYSFAACTDDVTVCFNCQTVSALTSGLSRYSAQPTPC